MAYLLITAVVKMDGHADDIDAPQTEKTDAMSGQEAMRRFESLDKSVGQI